MLGGCKVGGNDLKLLTYNISLICCLVFGGSILAGKDRPSARADRKTEREREQGKT